MVRNPENNEHYSDQTGHKARGQAKKTRDAFNRVFGVPFFPADQQFLAINQTYPLPNTEQQRIRRTMFRSPQDGRRRR
jgi:hypothetical protein